MTMAPERAEAAWRVTAYLDGNEVRWHLLRRDQAADGPVWRQFKDRATAIPPNGFYEESALSWMREIGIDPNQTRVALALPDGGEWVRPAR